jgi:CheY-like chemotaxis protein
LALLAGRKLLLADDSLTIQKVVEITFADEGVTVISVGTGEEALARLAETAPDVVLADVCMPSPNGYEICESIKQNAELRHIPVMLLVGSFEPFDEAEARRVGANDILTKPFQSIRRLIDRVGGLVSGKQDPDQVPTAELPQVDKPVEAERMSPGELEITTANTQPLPDSLAERFGSKPPDGPPAESTPASASVVKTPENGRAMDNSNLQTETMADPGEVLLDLGDLTPARSAAEDFVLDIDLDEAAEPAMAGTFSGARSHAFVEPQVSAPTGVEWQIESEPNGMPAAVNTGELKPGSSRQFEDTQEWMRQPVQSSAAPVDSTEARKLERVTDEPVDGQPAPAAAIASASPLTSANQLSPEVIDAIARRAVEQLSERVVQQIAWEVVPQLAELMIKRKLEEKDPQPK